MIMRINILIKGFINIYTRRDLISILNPNPIQITTKRQLKMQGSMSLSKNLSTDTYT